MYGIARITPRKTNHNVLNAFLAMFYLKIFVTDQQAIASTSITSVTNVRNVYQDISFNRIHVQLILVKVDNIVIRLVIAQREKLKDACSTFHPMVNVKFVSKVIGWTQYQKNALLDPSVLKIMLSILISYNLINAKKYKLFVNTGQVMDVGHASCLII